MNTRKAIPLALTLVVAAAGLAPALAAPAKGFTEEYDVQGTPWVNPPTGPPCSDGTMEGASRTSRTFKLPSAGTIEVTVNGFRGDWDTSIQNEAGAVLAAGSGTDTGDTASITADGTEKATMKLKKAMTVKVAACNFLGSPTAHVKVVFKPR